MHASLTDLLENLRSGPLRVRSDGLLQSANVDGSPRTGLAAGRKLARHSNRFAVLVATRPRASPTPWPMRQSAWAEIEPIAGGRSGKARIRAQRHASDLAALKARAHHRAGAFR